VLHRFGRAGGGDDLAAFDTAIAVAVIAVVMRVDERADLCAADLPEAVKHGDSVRRVEHGVDQQRLAAIGHQPRVGKSPAAVGLEIGEGAVAEFDNAGFIACLAKM
jgi:hypothetical protein